MQKLRPERAQGYELLDTPGHEARLLAENLQDMGRANRWLGGAWLIEHTLLALSSAQPARLPTSILDVASGGAEIPRLLAASAHRRGTAVSIIASDKSPEVLRIAAADRPPTTDHQPATSSHQEPYSRNGLQLDEQLTANDQHKPLSSSVVHPPSSVVRRPSPVVQHSSSVAYLAADGLALPLPDASVEVTICSLALHHFTPLEAIQLLSELWRVARHAVIIDDLLRSWLSYAGAWLFSHISSSNRLTRHDGPLSALRAYTHSELLALTTAAGFGTPASTRHLGYRAVLGFVKG